MGNRFRQLNGYQSIVAGHAIVAAITFLAVVPAAILIASFYHRNPHLALRIHIGLQVLTVILTTVVFVLGYFAVGPERSLTNPHHGIGLTLFLLVLLQAFGGWVIKRLEKNKIRYYIPVKLMVCGITDTMFQHNTDWKIVTPMARSWYCVVGNSPDPDRSHIVRLAISSVHPVRAVYVRAAGSVLYSGAPKP